MAAQCNRTSLSAGLAAYSLMALNPRLADNVTAIVPVNSIVELKLPFIRYWFDGLEQTFTKPGGHDTLGLKVVAYALTPEESLCLAELIRESLELEPGTMAAVDMPDSRTVMKVGRCVPTHFSQYMDGDAFASELRFAMTISKTNKIQ